MKTKALLAVFGLALMMLGMVNVVHMPTAAACSCADPTTQELVESTDFIAEVQVLGPLGKREWGTAYDVRVLKVWKGETNPQATVVTEEETTACGLGKLDPGETLTIWGSASDAPGEYGSTWCGLPRDDTWTSMVDAPTVVAEPLDNVNPPDPPNLSVLPWPLLLPAMWFLWGR